MRGRGRIVGLVFGALVALAALPTGCGDSGGGQAPIPAAFSLRLERQMCYGPCPVYTVTVDAAGAVTYDGVFFVRVKEKADGRIGSKALRRLIAALDEIGFFSLEDQYFYFGPGCEHPSSDAQTVIVTATRSGVTHRLRHYYGCNSADPILDELVDLQLEIDDALNTRQWVFCSDDDSFFTTSCDDFPV